MSALLHAECLCDLKALTSQALSPACENLVNQSWVEAVPTGPIRDADSVSLKVTRCQPLADRREVELLEGVFGHVCTGVVASTIVYRCTLGA